MFQWGGNIRDKFLKGILCGKRIEPQCFCGKEGYSGAALIGRVKVWGKEKKSEPFQKPMESLMESNSCNSCLKRHSKHLNLASLQKNIHSTHTLIGLKLLCENTNIPAAQNDFQHVRYVILWPEKCFFSRRLVYLEDKNTEVSLPGGFYNSRREGMLLKWMFTINTMSNLGSVLRFHSCVAANSKNVKYAFLLLLWIPVEDMTGGGKINSGFWSKRYHFDSRDIALCPLFGWAIKTKRYNSCQKDIIISHIT